MAAILRLEHVECPRQRCHVEPERRDEFLGQNLDASEKYQFYAHFAAAKWRIGTIWPAGDGEAQNFAHASASCRRFWNRSPRR